MRIELGDAFVGRVGIVDVVVGELLALHLARGGDAETDVRRAIERRRLVRVLAVAQWLDQPAAERAIAGRDVVDLLGEPIGDRRIVGRRARKSLGGELAAQLQRRHAAVGFEFRNERGVIARLDRDRDVGMVLRRGADHRHAADVDVLDAGGEIAAARGGGFERIQTDRQNIDRADAVRAHRLGMGGIVAHGEKPAMHRRMQRLDPAIHHFGESGQFADVEYLEAGVAQRFAGTAGRDELDAEAGQRAREFDHARFVGDGNQGARGAAQMLGHGVSLHLLTRFVIPAEPQQPAPRNDEPHSGNLGSSSSCGWRAVPVPLVVLTCCKLHCTRGAVRAWPWMTICAVRRGPSLPAR